MSEKSSICRSSNGVSIQLNQYKTETQVCDRYFPLSLVKIATGDVSASRYPRDIPFRECVEGVRAKSEQVNDILTAIPNVVAVFPNRKVAKPSPYRSKATNLNFNMTTASKSSVLGLKSTCYFHHQ